MAAIKLGLLANAELAEATRQLIDACPQAPVVCDPVLASGSGRALGRDLLRGLRQFILPVTTLATPNLPELARLSDQPQADTEVQARALLALGCELVLVTGEHAGTGPIRNQLVGGSQIEFYEWERLPGAYHGSGCTLAASIAALLARGSDPWSAVHEAQDYTWQTLAHAEQPGHGQSLPNRLFWAEEEADADA